jgi:hypothetical protein
MLGNVAIKRQWLMDFTYYMLAYISIHGHADQMRLMPVIVFWYLLFVLNFLFG